MNEYLAFLLEAAGAAAFDIDVQSATLLSSPSLSQLFGYGADHALTFREARAALAPEAQAVALSLLEAATRGERRFERAFQIQAADGATRSLLARGEVLLDGRGVPHRVRGAVFDATFRMTARQALRLALQDALQDLTDPTEMLRTAARIVNEHLRTGIVAFAERVPDGALMVSTVEGPHPDWTGDERALLDEALSCTRSALARARAFLALKHSEDHYRHMVDLNPEVPWTALPDGKVDFAPKRWLEWTGNVGLGESWTEAVLPDDLPGVLANWTRCLDTGTPLDHEFRIRRHGEFVWIRSRAFPRRDAQGRIIKWYGSLEDINARKLSQEALRRSEEFHRFAVEAGHIGTWDLDLATASCTVSAGMAEMMGLAPQRTVLTREQWKAAFHAPDYQVAEQLLRKVLKHGPTIEMEVRVALPDGQLRWLFARGAIERDTSGRARRIHGASIETTARKQEEDALRKAKTAAEEANRMKDEFLATVSHELRTPLAAILLWSRQMTNPAMKPHDLSRAVAAIQQSAEMQSRLIADLLDLSRMIAGQLRLQPEMADVAALAFAALELARPTMVAKQIRLKVDIHPHLTAWVDPNRIQQLLSNLLGNAVKFTAAGGEVSLRLHRVDGQIRLEVADTGLGISPEFLPHVFERFRQAEMKESRQQPGLGIGLALCKSVAELHGGSIRAASAGLNQGAVFTVLLPHQSRGDVIPRSTGLRPPRNEQTLAGLRLLLVEDDFHTREALAWTLKQAGATVDVFGDGREVLERLRAATPDNTPDVMVCDIGLPAMDGYEVIRRVHAVNSEQGRPPIPACAVSAFVRDADRQKALAAGFDLHLPKPVEPTVLIEAVEELASIARHESARRARAAAGT